MISNSHQYYAAMLLDTVTEDYLNNNIGRMYELAWVGDLNNDGREDIILLDQTQYNFELFDDPSFVAPQNLIRILYSNGLSFEQQIVHGVESLEFVSALDVLDLDNDGLLDIAIYQTGSTYPVGDGSNYATPQDVVWNNSESWAVEEIDSRRYVGHGGAAGDINGDGYADLLILDENAPNNSLIYINDQNRGFSPRYLSDDTGQNSFEINGLPGLSGQAALLDHDGDGDLDLQITGDNFETSNVFVYLNEDGIFQADPEQITLFELTETRTTLESLNSGLDLDALLSVNPSGRFWDRQLADFDSDGIPEVVHWLDAGPVLRPYVLGFDGEEYVDRTDDFFDVSDFYNFYLDDFEGGFTSRVLDYDADGRLEFYISHDNNTAYHRMPDKVSFVYEQDDSGIFRPEQLFDYRTIVGTYSEQTMPIDIDGDGDFELVGMKWLGYDSLRDELSLCCLYDYAVPALNIYYRDSDYSQQDLDDFNELVRLQIESDFNMQVDTPQGGYLVDGNGEGLAYQLEPYHFYAAQREGSFFDTYYQSLPTRLDLGNSSLAFDLDGNAGKVAKILGAVFGSEAVQNESYAGIGLDHLDKGMSYEELMVLAIDVAVGADADSNAVVNHLYEKVVGVTPTLEQAQPFIDLLENDTYSKGSLGVLAAETELNAQNINLVGLATSGLEYIPVA